MHTLQKIATMILFLLILVWCTGNKTTIDSSAILQETIPVTELELSFIDPIWDGITVPEGQWCSMFNGNGSSPEIQVHNIPEETLSLSIAVSDRSFTANDNGWHGIFGLLIENSTSTIIPSIPGESFEVDDNVFVIEEARGGRSKGGIYLPPCSGWNVNEYYITVQALDSTDPTTANILATQDIELGAY